MAKNKDVILENLLDLIKEIELVYNLSPELENDQIENLRNQILAIFEDKEVSQTY